MESGSPTTPLFLRPGSSYQGKTASTRIANTISNVAVLGKKKIIVLLCKAVLLLSRHIQLSNNLYHCGSTTDCHKQMRSLSLIIIFAVVLTFWLKRRSRNRILLYQITKGHFIIKIISIFTYFCDIIFQFFLTFSAFWRSTSITSKNSQSVIFCLFTFSVNTMQQITQFPFYFSVAIDNWTRFKLILPQTDIECGKLTTRLPKEIVPGTSEMAIFEKGVSFLYWTTSLYPLSQANINEVHSAQSLMSEKSSSNFTKFTTSVCPLWQVLLPSTQCTVFENHRKSLIQHCERSELCLHFEWTKVH